MKEICLEFYISKFNSIDSDEKLNLDFISPIQRRRLSKLDKYAVHTIKNNFSDKIENIIFSSQNGEIERLLKIINQYCDNDEVSPNTFAGSVHNYPVGFFLLTEGCPIPYTALSAGNNSLSAGLVAAVISKYENVMYCFADVYDERVVSFSVNINKTPSSASEKYILKIKSNDAGKDVYDEYVRLFNGDINKLVTPLFEIERVDIND